MAERVLRALRRAGAYGALYGGDPGAPQVGVTVPVPDGAGLMLAVSALQAAGVTATLLAPTALARLAPDALRAATLAGLEVAGSGDPRDLPLLEVTAGQPAAAWDATGLGPAALRALAARGVPLLPEPQGAPQHGQVLRLPPQGLGDALAELAGLGYRPVPVGALPGLRSGTGRDLGFHVYRRVVEDRFTRQHHVIDLTQRADGVMRVAPLKDAPPPLPLPPGTPTAELHLNSARLVGLAARNLIATYRAYQRSLKDVAHAMQTRPELQDAQAVFAVTLFHGPLEKSGFTLLDLPPLQARWYGLGFRLLRVAYGTTRTPSEGTPKMAWMPRDAFLKRYG